MHDISGSHILIVDDTLKNIQVLGTVLRNEGFKLTVAQNGQQAIDSVARVRPDLILMDVMKSVLDGHQACAALKKDSDTADIPIIFLTAKVETEDIMKVFELGAVDHVTKPFNSAELLARVRTHLTIRHLQSALQDRIEALNEALAQIERMYREHGAFLRHELNNAITPILGFADMMVRRPDLPGDRRSKWLGNILSAATSMRELLDSLKKLQELERGDQVMQCVPMDLTSFVEAEVRAQESAFPGVVAIDFVAGVEDGAVKADASFLIGVFRNLLKNAIEHVRDLPEMERRVRVRLSGEAGAVVTEINNSGPAVPSDRLATFFEKFNSTKGAAGGTGLGTSFAALVTRAHGGTISVASTDADGTTVTVRLPR